MLDQKVVDIVLKMQLVFPYSPQGSCYCAHQSHPKMFLVFVFAMHKKSLNA